MNDWELIITREAYHPQSNGLVEGRPHQDPEKVSGILYFVLSSNHFNLIGTEILYVLPI